jgi:hypothetical protein
VIERKLREWARDNAYTLVFLAAMFFVTWLVQVVLAYVL